MFVLLLLFVSSAAASSISRIVNGDNAEMVDHPHQVSLESGGSHICGASILAPHWVLTAAHCVTGSASNYAIATNSGRRGHQETIYQVQSVTRHPNYQSGAGAYPNDIAILYLAEAIDLTNNVHRAIALAPSNADFTGQTCTISGWGRLILRWDNRDTLTCGNGNLPTTLQETTGTILSGNGCAGYWGSNINDNVHICIHNPSTGSCNGDSGGPMVCNNVLAGVTSWGASGCTVTYPSVYTKVSNYVSWIQTQMGSK